MIRYFSLDNSILNDRTADDLHARDFVWIDLHEPSRSETEALEKQLQIVLPSQDDMAEIEISSRLYVENSVLYMTALVPLQIAQDDILLKPVTFVVSKERLVTMRFHDPRTFETFVNRASNSPLDGSGAVGVMLGLLETIVDRLADMLEQASRDIDGVSRVVFPRKGSNATDVLNYREALENIGRKGEVTSDIRDSLMTIERLLTFLGLRSLAQDSTDQATIKALGQDVRSLLDHASFLSQKITFLLDGTLGLVNIEQNAIIKIFSVAAVIFLPPTLVASIYGMNFAIMPELAWNWGYPMAIGLMIVSAILPYLLFKRRGWL